MPHLKRVDYKQLIKVFDDLERAGKDMVKRQSKSRKLVDSMRMKLTSRKHNPKPFIMFEDSMELADRGRHGKNWEWVRRKNMERFENS